MELVAFLVAAGLLAVLRSGLTARLNTPAFPWGTLVVNVGGCFCAAVVVAVAPASWSTVVGVAALGAFTTFSTFAVELAAMWSDHPGRAIAYGVSTTVGAVGVAVVGLGF